MPIAWRRDLLDATPLAVVFCHALLLLPPQHLLRPVSKSTTRFRCLSTKYQQTAAWNWAGSTLSQRKQNWLSVGPQSPAWREPLGILSSSGQSPNYILIILYTMYNPISYTFMIIIFYILFLCRTWFQSMSI